MKIIINLSSSYSLHLLSISISLLLLLPCSPPSPPLSSALYFILSLTHFSLPSSIISLLPFIPSFITSFIPYFITFVTFSIILAIFSIPELFLLELSSTS